LKSKLILIICLAILILTGLASATTNINLSHPGNNSIIQSMPFTFNFSVSAVDNCTIRVNETIIINLNVSNITIGINTYIHTLANGSYNWTVNCTNQTSLPSAFLFEVSLFEQFLKISRCDSSTGGSLILIMLVGISLFFVGIAMCFNNGLFGFFAAILFFISSWYVSPCSGIYGFVMGIFGMVMLIWFVTQLSHGFENKTFKP